MTLRTRRSFLIETGTACSGIVLLRLPLSHSILVQGTPAASTLHAIGHAVLPSELGLQEKDAVVDHFQEWIENFPDRVPLQPGFGTAEIRYGPPDPGPRWESHLSELDRVAEQEFRSPFLALIKSQQVELLRLELSNAENLLITESPARADHVSVGLLSYFYRSPRATNLCYKAEIHKDSCRPLKTAGQKPPPLAGQG